MHASGTFHSLSKDALFDTLGGGPGIAEVTHGFGNALGRLTVGGFVQHAPHLHAQLGHIHQLLASRAVYGITTSPSAIFFRNRAISDFIGESIQPVRIEKEG
jgi:hypothetical protein